MEPYPDQAEMDAQLARRRRRQRREWLALSHSERFRRMNELQARMWARLMASPHGYEAFIRRNFRKRAIHAKPEDFA